MAILENIEQVSKSITRTPGRTERVEEFAGTFENLKQDIEDNLRPGVISDRYGLAGEEEMIVSAQLRREKGGLGNLSIRRIKRENTGTFSIDFQQIQKPIKAWHSDLSDPAMRPDLSLISRWEALKDSKTYPGAYAAYQYVDTTSTEPELKNLEGETLRLAKMINLGVESYLLFSPILQKTTLVIKSDSELSQKIGANVGMIDSPAGGENGSILNFGMITNLVALRDYWLKITDRMTQNADGTFVRVEAWQGFDQNFGVYDSTDLES